MSYKDFTEMPMWQNALEIGEEVFRITVVLPKSEDYGLTSQLRRASVSISANIAEAFGRSGKKDKAKFYDYARGSAFETNSLLLYGAKVGYFSEEEINKIIEKSKVVIHDINKVKSYILKQLSVQGYVSDIEAEYPHPQPQSNPEPHPQSQTQAQSNPEPQSQSQTQPYPQS